MKGWRLLEAPELDILSAYAAPQEEIPAVAVTPGWYVVGGFYLHASIRLLFEVIGSVSHSSLTMNVRIFDLTTNLPVFTFTAFEGQLTDEKFLSTGVFLTGARTYQIQVEVLGSTTGDEYFGVLRSAGPTL